jgi:hypothetical protein
MSNAALRVVISSCFLVVVMLGSWVVSGPTMAASTKYPSDYFDLTNWKITLPIPDEKGRAREIKQLRNFASPYFFYTDEGAMAFRAPTDGTTTKNSKYARSELRERMYGEDAAWTLERGGILTATLKIDKAPMTIDGVKGRMVIGQIHGEDDELVRLYWDREEIYFYNDKSSDDNKEHRFELVDALGNTPRVKMGRTFSYRIVALEDVLKVSVTIDGRDYHSVTPINDFWQSQKLYFKAGVYLGVNKDQGAFGSGQVSFYALDVAHDGRVREAALGEHAP